MDICTAHDYSLILVHLLTADKMSNSNYDAIKILEGYKYDRLFVERHPEFPKSILLSFKLLDENGEVLYYWKNQPSIDYLNKS